MPCARPVPSAFENAPLGAINAWHDSEGPGLIGGPDGKIACHFHLPTGSELRPAKRVFHHSARQPKHRLDPADSPNRYGDASNHFFRRSAEDSAHGISLMLEPSPKKGARANDSHADGFSFVHAPHDAAIGSTLFGNAIACPALTTRPSLRAVDTSLLRWGMRFQGAASLSAPLGVA